MKKFFTISLLLITFAACKKDATKVAQTAVQSDYLLKIDSLTIQGTGAFPFYKNEGPKTVYLVVTKASTSHSLDEVIADLSARGYKPINENYWYEALKQYQAE